VSKIIIENNTGMSIQEAMGYVAKVIDGGLVSKTSKGEQYCFATTWEDGVSVYASKNKHSDKFIVSISSEES
jgi:hypothetical protein